MKVQLFFSVAQVRCFWWCFCFRSGLVALFLKMSERLQLQFTPCEALPSVWISFAWQYSQTCGHPGCLCTFSYPTSSFQSTLHLICFDTATVMRPGPVLLPLTTRCRHHLSSRTPLPYLHTPVHLLTHTQLLPILKAYLNTTLPPLCLSVFFIVPVSVLGLCLPFCLLNQFNLHLDPDLVLSTALPSVPWQPPLSVMALCDLPSLWRVSMIVFWTIAKSAVFPIIVVSKNKRYPEFILYEWSLIETQICK